MDDELELDLTRAPLVKPVLDLDLEGQYQQVGVVEVFGLADTGIKQLAVRPEPVEGLSGLPVHASTSSARTDGVLPSMEEFAIAKLAEQYSYKGNLTIGALEDEIVFRVRRSASDVLEAGKALIILKEVAGHGNFNKRLSLMGFKERTAQNYMRVAEAFGKNASNAYLANEIGQYQKLLEMTFFENDELETIANGGDIDGIDIEQIKALSAPKLKKLIQSRVETETKAVLEQTKTLEENVASLTRQIDNHEKHYAELEAKHEVATHKLTKLSAAKNPANVFNAETMAIREEAYALEYGARVYIDALSVKFQWCLNNTEFSDIDNEARFNALAIALGGIYASVDTLYREMTDIFDTFGKDFPPELAGKHALTPDERQRVEDCKLMINHEFVVDSAGREARREDKNRRGAGRPAGSANKPK